MVEKATKVVLMITLPLSVLLFVKGCYATALKIRLTFEMYIGELNCSKQLSRIKQNKPCFITAAGHRGGEDPV